MKSPILTTSPHGAQALQHTEDLSMRLGQKVGNQLFTLKEVYVPKGQQPAEMTFTGEELDSLAALWIEWRKKNA